MLPWLDFTCAVVSPQRGSAMRFRQFLQIALAGMLLCLSGCSRPPGANITSVLDRCAEVSRKAAVLNQAPGAQASFIASEFRKIDVTSCPTDFQMAFNAHIIAWQQAAAPLSNDSMGTALVEGLVGGLVENPSLIGGAHQQAALAGQQINATYFELTQIAARYGARIPRSVAGEN